MIDILLANTLVGSALAPNSSAATSSVCVVDAATILQLTPDEFDQSSTTGWRPISAKPGCREAAADLIEEYRRSNWNKLLPHELHINYWHEGQLRAFEGQTDRAIPLLLAGINPDSIDGFPHYAMATVAFLQEDLVALRAARGRLAALPEPTWFIEAKDKGQIRHDARWPPNLDVVDGLIMCFGNSYSVAYSDSSCRPSGS